MDHAHEVICIWYNFIDSPQCVDMMRVVMNASSKMAHGSMSSDNIRIIFFVLYDDFPLGGGGD